MSTTEKHYTSGDYWKDRGSEDSAYKADLALTSLSSANIEVRGGAQGC